ncbi:XRE family transcriptional regulator [Streptomyces sp. MST-110588]|uniref:helix-turn-helix domain-containing protein n=1 Tax=Streptomyces sp. MST-110588 TaxID=2833628 RepID=UPI001F5D4D29|nr:XRE family transcriptional regulator [Streptomyces sp. MST-110588]
MLDLVALGTRVQALRHDRRLTLQQLAEAADVSVSMLSSVERGRKAPTVVVLARIADGLGVPLAGLVTQPDDHRVIVRRAADQESIDEPGGWRRTILTPVVPGVNFEWIRTTLPPSCDAGRFPAYAPGSHEYVVVASGTLRLSLADTSVDLHEGDSAYFAADITHGYANEGPDPCTYYVAALIMRPARAGRAHGRPHRATPTPNTGHMWGTAELRVRGGARTEAAVTALNPRMSGDLTMANSRPLRAGFSHRVQALRAYRHRAPPRKAATLLSNGVKLALRKGRLQVGRPSGGMPVVISRRDCAVGDTG